METTHHSGGLIGAASSINARAKSAFSFISNPDRMAIWLVLFAGVVTILKKNGVNIPEYMMLFGVALGIAALLYEMSAARAMMRSFWEGKGFSLMCNGLIWAVAFGFSVNNWIGAASEGQAEKTNLHKAAYAATADTRQALKEAEDTLARLKGKFDWSKSLDAPESYDARIEAAEADAKYESTRGGCKSRCIAKQQLAANLKAERANAIDRAATAEEIKVAERQVMEAREVASNTKTETSTERSDLLILTSYAGMTEQSAQIFNGLFSIIVVSIFLSFGSMRDEFAKLANEGPRRPFEMFGKVYRWFYRLLTGKQAPQPVYNVTVEGDGKGGEALDKAKALERRIMSAARNYAQPSHA